MYLIVKRSCWSNNRLQKSSLIWWGFVCTERVFPHKLRNFLSDVSACRSVYCQLQTDATSFQPGKCCSPYCILLYRILSQRPVQIRKAHRADGVGLSQLFFYLNDIEGDCFVSRHDVCWWGWGGGGAWEEITSRVSEKRELWLLVKGLRQLHTSRLHGRKPFAL